MAAVLLKIANKPLSTNSHCCWSDYRCPEWMPIVGWFEVDNLSLYVQILPQCISLFRLLIDLLRLVQTFSITERMPNETPLVNYLMCSPNSLLVHRPTIQGNHTDQSQTNHSAQVTDNHAFSKVGVLQDDKTPSVSWAGTHVWCDLLCFLTRCDPSTLSQTNHSAKRNMFVPEGERLLQDDESAEQRRPCEPAAVYRGRPSCFLLYCRVTLMNIIEGINRFIV